VFEIKLQRVASKYASRGLDGQRQSAEELLAFLALTPPHIREVRKSPKVGTMLSRIALRFHIKEDLLWARLRELRATSRDRQGASPVRDTMTEVEAAPTGPKAQAAAA